MTADNGMDVSPSWQELKQERDALASFRYRVAHYVFRYQGGHFDAESLAEAMMVLDSTKPANSLARLKAEWQAEALEDARDACDGVARGQEDLAWMHAETTPDGERVIAEPGIPYSNKALGATHCRDDIERMITELRRQAEGGGS